MNDITATATATEPERRTASGEGIDTALLRGFLKETPGRSGSHRPFSQAAPTRPGEEAARAMRVSPAS
jgi:hypothetical protein